MVKEIVISKGAAGLRRSAVAERLRLREEWSTLKGTDDENEPPAKVKKKQLSMLSRNLHDKRGNYKKTGKNVTKFNKASSDDKENSQPSSEALRGVVALVDVGAASRALALRAALAALGATVAPAWSTLVTHLVWAQGGCRVTRARARSLACSVVSPLWVEACASGSRRVPESLFPSTARASDLPSPATLCRLLKRAERENWQLPDPESEDSEGEARPARLRISSDTDQRSSEGDSTRASTDAEVRVNTAPRRALPVSISPIENPKSRRKLFTVRAEGEEESEAEETPVRVTKAKTRPQDASKRPEKKNQVDRVPQRQSRVKYNLTQEQRKRLENAERMARRLANPRAENRTEEARTQQSKRNVPRVVLSGMPKSQYQAVIRAIHTMNGIVQRHVDRRTTHVLLGTCKPDSNGNNTSRPNANVQKTKEASAKDPSGSCRQCNSPETLMSRLFEADNGVNICNCSNAKDQDGDVIICTPRNDNVINSDANNAGDVRLNTSDVCCITSDKRLRTLKTLLGAVRGCRVLHAVWALDSLKEGKWLPHIGYEVTHLMNIAQKARIERSATDKMHTNYGYNVFRRKQVCVTETANQRDAAVQLLSLCGAELLEEADARENILNGAQNGGRTEKPGFSQKSGRTQNGGLTQNGADVNDGCDIVIVGKGSDEVSSKWVFDSVAAGRPRTIRRYMNKNIIS